MAAESHVRRKAHIRLRSLPTEVVSTRSDPLPSSSGTQVRVVKVVRSVKALARLSDASAARVDRAFCSLLS